MSLKVEFDFNKYSRKSKNLGIGDVIKKVNFDSNEKKTIIFNSVFIGRFSNQSLEGSINELHSKGFKIKNNTLNLLFQIQNL